MFPRYTFYQEGVNVGLWPIVHSGTGVTFLVEKRHEHASVPVARETGINSYSYAVSEPMSDVDDMGGSLSTFTPPVPVFRETVTRRAGLPLGRVSISCHWRMWVSLHPEMITFRLWKVWQLMVM